MSRQRLLRHIVSLLRIIVNKHSNTNDEHRLFHGVTCVSTRVFIVEFKTTTAASGAIAVGTKAPCFFHYILCTIIFFEGAGSNQG